MRSNVGVKTGCKFPGSFCFKQGELHFQPRKSERLWLSTTRSWATSKTNTRWAWRARRLVSTLLNWLWRWSCFWFV